MSGGQAGAPADDDHVPWSPESRNRSGQTPCCCNGRGRGEAVGDREGLEKLKRVCRRVEPSERQHDDRNFLAFGPGRPNMWSKRWGNETYGSGLKRIESKNGNASGLFYAKTNTLRKRTCQALVSTRSFVPRGERLRFAHTAPQERKIGSVH